MTHEPTLKILGTTILAVRHNGQFTMIGDGQMTLGDSILKATARKVRRMHDDKIIAGFAGSTADAMALFERFEEMLRQFNGRLLRAATELAKLWRTDRVLRRLEALMIVGDDKNTLTISGMGDVLEPDDGVTSVGSGSIAALAAARALVRYAPNLSSEEIATNAMKIASEIDIYTNDRFVVESLQAAS